MSFLPSSGYKDNPMVFYSLVRGSSEETNKNKMFFIEKHQRDGLMYADVRVNQPLDFERVKEYNLTIRVEVCTNHSET